MRKPIFITLSLMGIGFAGAWAVSHHGSSGPAKPVPVIARTGDKPLQLVTWKPARISTLANAASVPQLVVPKPVYVAPTPTYTPRRTTPVYHAPAAPQPKWTVVVR